MNSKIFITGVSGFIGFHTAKKLLDDDNQVYGIDNLNTYYNIKLKNDRLDILKKYPNFRFSQIDICDFSRLIDIVSEFKPYKIIHLAAQAGVQYSIENPFSYVKSNLEGFVNILELCRKCKIDHLIYASSSSVYGDKNTTPFHVEDNTDFPISLYSATKKSNELIAHSYSNLYKIKTTGLRFFTVYGPWGRPDMSYFIFTEKIFMNEPIKIFNHGRLKRDFTYIDDIVSGIISSLNINKKYSIYNLGNNKSISILELVSLIEDELGVKAKIEFLPERIADVKQTFADIDQSIDDLGYNPNIKINVGVKKFIDWYKNYKK